MKTKYILQTTYTDYINSDRDTDQELFHDEAELMNCIWDLQKWGDFLGEDHGFIHFGHYTKHLKLDIKCIKGE